MEENKTVSFEDALKKLEHIVLELEKEEVPLEKAIDLYQEGMQLSKLCDEKLQKAENKMVQVLNKEDEIEPFDLQEE